MIAIRDLCNILPISVQHKYILRMLTFKDLDWYIHNCREPYYNRYLDFSFAKDVSQDKLQTIFYNLTVGYAIKATNVSEARLVLVDKFTNEIVGGCTIFEKEYEKEYEIAYFIVPSMQNMGLGTYFIKTLLSELKKSKFKFEKISAIVMNTNIESANLLKRLGFSKEKEYVGRRGVNTVYYINIADIKNIETKKNNKVTHKKKVSKHTK